MQGRITHLELLEISSRYRQHADIIRVCTAVAKLKELLDEALDFADHARSCSEGIMIPLKPGEYIYPCKCGYRDWQETVEKILEETDDLDQG